MLERFGVDARVYHRPGQISGGQAQRMALCRALLTDAQVVLADGPTANLDAENTRVVLDALVERARAGAAVVLASHDLAVVARCDVVIDLP